MQYYKDVYERVKMVVSDEDLKIWDMFFSKEFQGMLDDDANKEEEKFSFDEFIRDIFKSDENDIIQPKKFKCKVQNCTKSYTSNYGLRYHTKHTHKMQKDVYGRPFICPRNNCNNCYKTRNGLKYHIMNFHGGLFDKK